MAYEEGVQPQMALLQQLEAEAQYAFRYYADFDYCESKKWYSNELNSSFPLPLFRENILPKVYNSSCYQAVFFPKLKPPLWENNI